MVPTFHIFVPDAHVGLEALAQRLERDDSVFSHPRHVENAYVLCGTADVAQRVRERLERDPRAALSDQAIIIVRSSSVTVHQLVSADVLRRVEDVLQPVLYASDIRLVDEGGQDISAVYKSAPSQLFADQAK